jgi:hypothetical protein
MSDSQNPTENCPMSSALYCQRKGQNYMALTDDYNECLDDIGEVKAILEDSYSPESSREELAAAIGKALDVLEEYDSEAEESEGESETDDLED